MSRKSYMQIHIEQMERDIQIVTEKIREAERHGQHDTAHTFRTIANAYSYQQANAKELSAEEEKYGRE